ncbi:putative endoplasmin [Monocercomonoides exilis]|uniref:putative endoplasmin n=1 Tax=Monocercomonoides exilis TaxID=2049356 RepID=UPI00355A15B9|nr:putative endoplasmin [Monocercomonoides exilis]|eukprot:MONOS_6592.1-p1 / transcript=MONOS_6592.1 / gene=MONOS_6592 / organism=Monocercomonoides_exilis_PA203 / gene_product=Grp94 / transcript_product=Grp94 / location=Mono_scaffold00210:42650-45185(-) / protein_length=822 / sequence_SO=supercontig / SO=protein_coding / is_pseudo=false
MLNVYLIASVVLVSLLGAEETKNEAASAANYEFTTDVSKMMKILINSLYSNKDIFLRELISNAADALNKVRFQALTDKDILGEGDNAKLDIRIIPDPEENTIAVVDRGIGMNETELIQNLGTIAHSGTQRFLDGVENGTSAVDLIGQFGVGFYSSFLVADKVVVTSKRKGDKQHVWVSDNAQSFEVYPDTSGTDLFRGTKVVLHLRDETYSDAKKIKELALHYSEFVDFPIYVRMERDMNDPEAQKRAAKQEEEEEEDEDEEKPRGETSYTTEEGKVYDFVHVNPRKAIWLRDPKTVSESDYVEFFRSLTRDYTGNPLTWTHFSAEGDVGFRSILYIPEDMPPVDTSDNAKNSAVKLYVHRVLITEEFDAFIPRYLAFVRGLVDSDDLQLNVSRETLQESKTLRQIGKKVVRKIIQMISEMAEKAESEGDPSYEKFYRTYHRFLKMGVMEDIPNRRRLARLLRFNTTKSEKTPISLDDYLERMRPGQSDFFYIAGDPATSNIQQSPFLIPYKKRGLEVLFLSDPVDEMVVREMKEYDKKLFICVTQVEKKALTTESEFEREKLKQWKKRFKPLVNFFKEALGEKVERVEVSTRLAADARTPCVLAHVEGSASANMERYTRAQNRADPRFYVHESRKVLEINPTNNLIKRMNVAVQQVEAQGIDGPDFDEELEERDAADEELEGNRKKLETMALLLYDTAVFESGYIIGDSNAYAANVYDVLTRMTGLPNAPVKSDEHLAKEQAKDVDDEPEKKESAKETEGEEEDDDEEEEKKEDDIVESEEQEEQEEARLREERRQKKMKEEEEKKKTDKKERQKEEKEEL